MSTLEFCCDDVAGAVHLCGCYTSGDWHEKCEGLCESVLPPCRRNQHRGLTQATSNTAPGNAVLFEKLSCGLRGILLRRQAFIQAEDVDLSAAVELGDEYLAKREVVKRAKERGWIASDSFEASMKAAAAIDNKWRQRCLIDALASTSCSDVGSVDDRKLLTERLTITRKSGKRFSSSLVAAKGNDV